MLKKLLRLLIVFSGLTAILLSISYLTFKIVFPKKRIKKMFINVVRGGLNREISLGDVSFGPISGLEITGFSVSRYPDFNSGTLLTGDKVEVAIEFMPLFRHRVNINDVVVDSPVLNIDKDKILNFSLQGMLPFKRLNRYFKPSGKGVEFSVPFVPPSSIKISNLKINNGALSCSSGSGGDGEEWQAGNIHLSAKDVCFGMPFSFTASGDMFRLNADISLKVSGVADLVNQKIEFDDIIINTDGSSLSLSGSVKSIFNMKKFSYSFDLRGDMAVFETLAGFFVSKENQDMPALAFLFGSTSAPAAFNISGSLDEVKVRSLK